MTNTLSDFIDNCWAIPANSIPYYDGCDWKFVQLPESGLNTCLDVQTCIDSQFISTLLSSADNSILIGVNGSLTINPLILQSLINVQLVGTNLSVGSTTVDLATILANWAFTIFDGSNSTTINLGDVLNIVGIDGMRVLIPANDTIHIGLPTPRQHMQVLTWNEVTGEAEWQNNQCCAQTLSFDTATNIISISGGNQVDLTSINTDNQELALSGNILSITQLGSWPQAVDLTNVNEHTLDLVGNLLSILGSDGIVNDTVDLTNVNEHTLSLTGNNLSILGSDGLVNAVVDLTNVNEHTLAITGWWDTGWVFVSILGSDGIVNNTIQLPRPDVANCADVAACPAISSINAAIAALTVRVMSLENQVQTLQGQLP